MNKRLQGCILIFLATLIWGASFAAQKSGLDYVGPHTFNLARSVIAVIVLIPMIIINDKISLKNTGDTLKPKTAEEKKRLFKNSIINGALVFGYMAFQQVGLIYTDSGKGAFITAMYIVIVPILGIFLGKRMRIIEWLCVALASFGLYNLCIPAGAGLSFGKGDILILICSFLGAVQVHVLAYCVANADTIRLALGQFIVVAIMSAVPAFLFEDPSFAGLVAGAVPVLYSGVLSSAIAMALQMTALKYVPPTAASFIMSLESVFGVFVGVLVLHEVMTGREALGCIIIFAAILLAQIPEKQPAEAVESAEAVVQTEDNN